MPYLSCSRCRLDLYSGNRSSALRACPACGRDLIVAEAGRPEPPRSIFLERRLPRARVSLARLVERERRVVAQRHSGGSPAAAGPRLSAPATLAEAQRSLVRFYAGRLAARGSHCASPVSAAGEH